MRTVLRTNLGLFFIRGASAGHVIPHGAVHRRLVSTQHFRTPVAKGPFIGHSFACHLYHEASRMTRRLLTVLVIGLLVFSSTAASAQQKPAKMVIDVSPKWNNYGPYLRRMLSAIQSQWDRILIDSKSTPPSGTFVAVKFTLDSKGHISRILDVGNTSSEPGEKCCITAVTMTAPFGDWTDDMIVTLGSSQEMSVRFYY